MPASTSVIYQLKVVLMGITSPMIWRRLLVRDDSTITDLHYILQITMGGLMITSISFVFMVITKYCKH